MSYAVVEYADYGHYHHDGEKYGSWEESHDYNFTGYVYYPSPREISGCHGLTLPAGAQNGDILYFVWVSYDTGNSFGREYHRMCDIGLYHTRNEANEIASLIENDYKNNKEDYYTVVSSTGEKIYTGDWKGYFEQFNEVRIEEVKLIIQDGVD